MPACCRHARTNPFIRSTVACLQRVGGDVQGMDLWEMAPLQPELITHRVEDAEGQTGNQGGQGAVLFMAPWGDLLASTQDVAGQQQSSLAIDE